VNEDLHERETSIYEIMAAAWLSHDTTLATEVVNVFCDRFETFRATTIEDKWKIFSTDVAPLFEKFDQSILRSLQVSEWVEKFRSKECIGQEKSENCSKSDSPAINSSYSILVDKQIKELLSTNELKVLPLINIDAQLGSTSLDVRLGTTFQTYQPNQSGIIDFRDDTANENAQQYSMVKDLDFKEGIILAPDQFILAHTLEYVGLPEGIAAQLEGRSSFARLGIQIHMTASFIDPGFHGSITFEIYNAGPNPIRLFPGYRIGQLRFFPCIKPNKPYNKKKNAKYKGLLGHSISLLKNDYEIDCLKD
jgi:dCTP deaminase